MDLDTGEIVGEHTGIHKWTLGQRSRIQSLPEPSFIGRKNVENNIIYVVSLMESIIKLAAETISVGSRNKSSLFIHHFMYHIRGPLDSLGASGASK